MTPLSGYRFMWIQVLFDLPVKTKEQRKAATHFRESLLDLGFDMAQFSVYMRFSDREKVDSYIEKIRLNLPKDGKVHILTFTDKQYANIVTFNGCIENKKLKNPEQFTLF